MPIRNQSIDFNLIRFNGSAPTPATPPSGHSVLFGVSGNGHTALSYMDEGGFIIRVHRDLVLLVRNNSGSTILRGKAVRFTGSTGAVPTIGLADGDVFDAGRPRAAIGLALEGIPNNSFGIIILSGLISDIDTSAFTEGVTVYLSTTAGDLTETAPTAAGSFIQPIGHVTRSHSTQGSLEIDIETPATQLLSNLTAGRVPYVATGPTLADDSTFLFNATTNTLTVPNIVGGSGLSDGLIIRATSNASPSTTAKVFLKPGNDTAACVEVGTDSGNNFARLGISTPGLYALDAPLCVYGVGGDIGYMVKVRAHFGGTGAKSCYIACETAGNVDADSQNASAGFTFHQIYRQMEWRMHNAGAQDGGLLFQSNQYGIGSNEFVFTLSRQGNAIINNSNSNPSAGTKALIFGDGTVPSGLVSNTAGLYANDVGGTVEMFAINEAGVSNQISGNFELADARLSDNVVLEDIANVFTSAIQTISASAVPGLRIIDTDEAADAKKFRVAVSGSSLYLQAISDDESTAAGTLSMSRTGVITGTGQITARVSITGTPQSIDSGDVDAIAWDTEESDVGGCFTLGDPTKLTVPTGGGGTYLIIGAPYYSSNATGGRLARLRKNGSGALTTVLINAFNGDITALETVTVAVLNAGDYVELQAYQTSTTTLTTGGTLTWIKLW